MLSASIMVDRRWAITKLLWPWAIFLRELKIACSEWLSSEEVASSKARIKGRLSRVRAIAAQAEAERQRRAKVIHATGEKQAASELVEAAEMLERQPKAIQLRYLQTLTEIAGDKSSTIVFPLDLVEKAKKALG